MVIGGRMVSRTVGGETRSYCYDGDRVIAEYDGSGTLLRRYVYGPGIDERIAVVDYEFTDIAYLYHHDGLGSVRALSDYTREIHERYDYTVFGEPTISDANGDPLTESAYGNPYMFTGRRYDPNTGLYNYRARWYQAEIGRFIQPDPIRYEDDYNLYRYVVNNPINKSDPLGLYEWEADVDAFTKKFCNCLAKIPYLSMGAQALEMGWCNRKLLPCVHFCNTDPTVPPSEIANCMEKCNAEHSKCCGRATLRKCKFKYKIKG